MSWWTVDIELQGVTRGGAATATICCVVCAQPLEWVAIGPCGHRVVCAGCIVQVRFVDKDMLCRLCKAPCPLLVVVRGDCPRGADALAELPPAPTERGRKGDFWYNIETAAYFADKQQYKAARCCLREWFVFLIIYVPIIMMGEVLAWTAARETSHTWLKVMAYVMITTIALLTASCMCAYPGFQVKMINVYIQLKIITLQIALVA